LLNSFWVMIIIWVCNILSLSYNCRVIRMFHTALKSQMVCGAWKLPNRPHCRDGHSGRTLNTSVFIAQRKDGLLGRSFKATSLSDHGLQNSWTMSLVSLLSLWIISKNPKVIWITCFRCGRAASHVHSQRVTWSVAGGRCCRRYFNTSEFWTWFTTTHADGVVLEDYYRFKKVRDSYLRNI